MAEKKKPEKKTIREQMDECTQCEYVKFQAPIPPSENKEPVYELKLESKDDRYKVDQISHDGVIVYTRRKDTISQTPWVNVVIARPIQCEQ